MLLPLFTFLFAIPPPPRRPTNQPTSLPQNKHTLFAKCFCFNYFNFFDSLRDWGGGKTDRQRGRMDIAWALCFQRETGRQRKEEEEKRSSWGGGGGSKRPGLANMFRVGNTLGWGTWSLRDLGARQTGGQKDGQTGRECRGRIFGESERRRRGEASDPGWQNCWKRFRLGGPVARENAQGCFRRCGDRPPARERGGASLQLSHGCAVLRSKSVSALNFFGNVLDAVRRGGRAVPKRAC
jgi:hypothetical protein